VVKTFITVRDFLFCSLWLKPIVFIEKINVVGKHTFLFLGKLQLFYEGMKDIPAGNPA
jgi:hypothetical protein